LATKQLIGHIDFYSMEKKSLEVNGKHQLFGYQHSLKYCFVT